MVVAAVTPNPACPTTMIQMPFSRSMKQVYVLPDTFMQDIRASIDRIQKRVLKEVDLPVEFTLDPSLSEWLGVKFRPDERFINFFWIDCKIPYGKGQKASARKILKLFQDCGEEFAGMFELDVDVRAEGL
jgi:hypothetical protein